MFTLVNWNGQVFSAEHLWRFFIVFEHSEFPQSIGTIRPMADSNPELSDNQHSDNDFEKIALPSEEETVESDKSSSKVRPGSSVTDRENSEQSTRMKKSVLDAQQDDQEQPATKCEPWFYCWICLDVVRSVNVLHLHSVIKKNTEGLWSINYVSTMVHQK